MRKDIIDAIVTFVMFRGEVLGFFRATKRHDEDEWVKEQPRLSGGVWVQDSYAHIGQHSEAACSILRNCRRAKLTEYMKLLREMEEIGYRVHAHQMGRLSLKGTR